MKHDIYLEHRLVYAYEQGWSHLDPHIFVCMARHTRAEKVRDDGESTTLKLLVTINPRGLAVAKGNHREAMRQYKPGEPRPTFRQFMELAIEDGFSHGCRCEFDCCGHWQTRASAYQTKPREFVVTIDGYRNV